jgi:nicotinate-nucleotide pyrophosphorylase (carboxylating)
MRWKVRRRGFSIPARRRPACACLISTQCDAEAAITIALDLSDGVLIKSNHIALAGGAVPALERAIRNRAWAQPIEIEVRSLEEVQQALNLGAEAILLDNVSVETVRQAVELCSRQAVRIPLECAGGITLENVRSYAETGVDFISVGALTQPSTAVDHEFASYSSSRF